ncbi:tRNA pseudouridine(13) synthase TruD [Actinobacillus succinogenes]|uniref:tRNA pseudouridine synthase D n=1 Tax=Actinobacillus succinogenes (strain ATCC 55618 / DSM 22257 / CCUG 43843 / 130Z) TaxID=339671 RepID=TRUD_ACTSZ|nr:tRNA pseudouridine(13) synthase TruD [Actinobacillus succinogenes]A6VR02.1 RecName: Full=tRNA pseudouridine synthase D; AltName: Full=tRNA pseudouridine(13) synthase; AltName: Full=tRNA pseudouridylate synthase D; AltName: Full=tRNA-uridine isomerase D [Actinobacillus succinogenes 130Z]ABR75399.1 tRNA pseudouridine synthase D TruD [Actinobacillus succinogenes 130Z]PHI40213.1 tRNA pseudouridine(13) synthase TruD [Actinobacillus succinogenes]
MLDLAYLQTAPEQTALLKQQATDFIVREELGYPLSGDGEFAAVKIRKTNANTIWAGEQLAKFCGISVRNMSYAGLKDRNAITDQWFSLHMPGKPTPDFSRFRIEGIEILEVTRHNRKIRTGSLQGNHFDILLRNADATEELNRRLNLVKRLGFPNYFTEQRFGRDGHNLTEAMRWAKGEIQVKDRKKRSFYLSAARGEVFNLVVSDRLQMGLATQVMPNDILQLAGSHSWFQANEKEDLNALQVRLEHHDILLTAPLIGDPPQSANALENQVVAQHQALLTLMKREHLKPARRPLLMRAQNLNWQFEPTGLRLQFFLPAGSYATALIRELVRVVD